MNRIADPGPGRPVGILKWETGLGVTLTQFEQMPGNVMHPDTFAFPRVFKDVKGACYGTLIEHFQPELEAETRKAARELAAEGVKLISASCGFNIILQTAVADAVDLPVCTSSLLQVPIVHRMLKKGAAIGILTADRRHLTRQHLEQAGITPDMAVVVAGVEDTGEFAKVRRDPHADLDVERFKAEVVATAKAMVAGHPDICALVLECTDLPPCSAALRQELGLPVFDYVTLLTWAASAT
jgi:maleate cis-trans isomerase